jgi:hypothetical protein
MANWNEYSFNSVQFETRFWPRATMCLQVVVHAHVVSPYPHWSIPAKISVGTNHLPAPTPDRSFPAWFPLVMKLYVSRRTHESSSYVFFHIIVRSIHKDAHESCIFLCSKQISHLKHRWSTPRVRFTTWRTIS